MFVEFVKFVIYACLIVIVSKYGLVILLRKLSEILEFKPKTIGEITGIATSVPELLTVCVSSINGLMSAGIVNIFSSNVVNLIQYLVSIFINKNYKYLKDKTIIFNLILIGITITIPMVLVIINVEISIEMALIFIWIYFLFRFFSNHIYNIEDKREKKIKNEKYRLKNEKIEIILYIIGLILTAIILFFVGNLLGNSLQNLCELFSIPEWVIGILLGIVTSVPEFVTFFESQKHYINNSEEERKHGVVEATNNLLTSNSLNLFIIQSIGILTYLIII